MSAPRRFPRLAVVSPFIDKSHGTERIVAEWISQLAETFEIHVYSQSVADLDLSKITWHRIPKLPGPHLVNFLWWFVANHLSRALDRWIGNLRYDIVFSPGPNCLDADAISVHIVFAAFLSKVRPELAFSKNPFPAWPRLLHRRLYYRLAVALERRVYPKSQIQLILTSRRSAPELAEFYGRHEPFPLIETGIDRQVFNPTRRAALRREARRTLGLGENDFAVLLIGNDWRKKGLLTLLEAATRMPEIPIRLLVVSSESQDLHQALHRGIFSAISARVLPLRRDVEFYYAAADVYAGPSLEDTFALPVAEAMACGLPVIASAAAGVSEIITDGVDGLILSDPRDAAALEAMIRRLYENKDFRDRLGERAAETTRKYTWENNGRELVAIFQEIMRRKSTGATQTLTQES